MNNNLTEALLVLVHVTISPIVLPVPVAPTGAVIVGRILIWALAAGAGTNGDISSISIIIVEQSDGGFAPPAASLLHQQCSPKQVQWIILIK
jgi:hypothetical protein